MSDLIKAGVRSIGNDAEEFMTDKPSEAYLATLTDNTREYIRSLEATLTTHEATIAALESDNRELLQRLTDLQLHIGGDA